MLDKGAEGGPYNWSIVLVIKEEEESKKARKQEN
jgi:hypothetical protein